MTSGNKQPLAWMKGLPFADESYAFEWIRTLGSAYFGGADLIECLETAGRIAEGDGESWYREWLETAERVRGLAEGSLASGHAVSAREAYLRASNYYRTAEFYIHADPKDERHLDAARRSRDCFVEALKLFSYRAEPVRIPYEGTTLPGYFLPSPLAEGNAPLLIAMTGFDGTAEELYFMGGAAAVARGYHCLLFEGPGQGMALREGGLLFRPDWEKVVTPVVDFAIEQPGVDPERMALLGMSMGGYLAPRALAFEHRLKAGVANGGVWSMAKAVEDALGPERVGWAESDPQKFDEAFQPLMAIPKIKWFVEDGFWKFGAGSPAELLRILQTYSMEGVADRIRCPMAIVEAESDLFMTGQPEILYEALTCPKLLMRFTAADAAETHCQAGAIAIATQRTFDWLDEVV